MGLCRYPRTLAAVKRRLFAQFPGVQPAEGATDDVSHTLWMIEQVGGIADQGKIDRWVGWICAKAHSLGVIDRDDDALTELRLLAANDLSEMQ